MTGPLPPGRERMLVRYPNALRVLTEKQGYTHRDIAATVFGSGAHSFVSRILRGEARTISRDAARCWARLVGYQLGELFMPVPSRKTGRTDRGAA